MPEYRVRSRSPYKSSQVGTHRSRQHKIQSRSRSRSRSPHRSHRTDRHSSHKHHATSAQTLPLNASLLQKQDLHTYRPLFGLYLDVQKQLDIEDLDEHEVKGRWKSFIKKWNSGDLAEGWYDVKTFEKAKRGTFGIQEQDRYSATTTQQHARGANHGASDSEDGDEIGPSLPIAASGVTWTQGQNTRAGPAIPSASDIQLRDEQAQEDAEKARNEYNRSLKVERRADRQVQKERLDELMPRAEPGSRERQLEKKQEMAASNKAFAAAKDAGGDVDLRDADVMGDEDSLGELRRMKEAEQRKKTEREVRREEILRTRIAEREERMKGLREKEAKTMEMLKGIAMARFGGGESG